jgi:hypothetical protein
MRFSCPACQRQYRLPSDRLAAGATARLTCPGCHAPLLLARLQGAEDLHVSAVAAAPLTSMDFFGDPGGKTPLPEPPPLPFAPVALPRKPTSPPRREVPTVSKGPDYDKLLQEFSVLFRLHKQKKRKGNLGIAALVLVPVLAVAVALGIAADSQTRGEWLAQAREWLGDRGQPTVAIAGPIAAAEPVPEVEPVHEADEARPDLPFPWPGLAQVEQEVARPAVIAVRADVPQAVAAQVPLAKPALHLEKPVVVAKVIASAKAIVAAKADVSARPIVPKPRAVAHRSPWPSTVAQPEPLHVAQPVAPARFLLDDDLAGDTDARPVAHRGAGPSAPPPPEP